MKHIFVRIQEGAEGEKKTLSCILLSGNDAQRFHDDPANFLGDYNNATVLNSWKVPGYLRNVTASDSVREAFDALLALNALSDFPQISDLFATIFEAGYQLASKEQPDDTKIPS